MSRFDTRLALALILAAGAALRFATLESQGFWFDEAFTVQIASLEPSAMLERLVATENTPPLYYVLTAVSERLFGADEAALRVLPALAGTLTIPVVAWAAAMLAGRRAALIAGALTASSPLLVWYSQEARSYSLLTLLAAVSFLSFVATLQGRGRRWAWAWSAASALALCTHYLAGPLVVVEAVWLARARALPRRELVIAIGLVLATALALLPLALAQSNITAWIETIPLGARLAQLPQHFLVGLSAPWQLLPPLVVAAVALAVAHAAMRAPRHALRPAALAATVAAASALVAGAGALVGSDYLITRNLLALWAPLAVALAIVLAASPARVAASVTAGALCLAGVALAIWNAATTAAGRPDWEPLAAPLERGGATAVASGSAFVLAPLGCS